MILRARVVVPVARPPIHNGAIAIAGNRITAVGRWSDFPDKKTEPVLDFGDAAILPGLVNAHCHLDYTAMAGEIPPQKSFTDWIKLITTAKASWSYSEFAESWLEGARMLLHTGTTTVADIEAVPDLLPDAWGATPLRVFSFLELTGVKSRRNPRTILKQTVDWIEALPEGRNRAWLSPHAPYSTVPELLRLCAATARRRRWRLTTHVAESNQEFEMFMHARGEIFDWLRRNERNMDDCGFGSPVQHLERAGLLGKNLLAVHVNYLAPGDEKLLGKRKVSVAHCPRSHAYFQHRPFPLHELTEAKVNVCLGTDSLATVRKTRRENVRLSLFDEMRALAKNQPALAPKEILQMGTVNGARALGMNQQIGEISKGAFADLITIPFSGKTADIYEAVLHYTGDVTTSMIDGQWAIAP